MRQKSPLNDPRLLLIQHKLDQGDLDDAQRLLAELGDVPKSRVASAFLATRLLFLRGRINPQGVIERLEDLLSLVDAFPEAIELLRAAREGELSGTESDSDETKGLSSVEELSHASQPQLRRARDSLGKPARMLPSIPRAPAVPRFSPPPDPTPSYVPRKRPPTEAPGTSGSTQAVVPTKGSVPEIQIGELDDLDAALGGQFAGALARDTGSDDKASSSLPSPRDDTKPPLPAQTPDPFVTPYGKPSAFESSLPPPPDHAGPKSLLELTSLLDEARYDEVIRALANHSSPSAEHLLLKSRALAGAGRRDEALNSLQKIEQAPLVDPSLRAAVARFLVEQDALDRALVQANRAQRDDPDSVAVRVTLAWASIRAALAERSELSLERAADLIDDAKPRSVPWPALVLGVRAAVHALRQAPDRAVNVAHRALEIDPRQPDALAALSLASAGLRRRHDAQQAWLRLLDVDALLADRVSSRLEAWGISLDELAPSIQPGHAGDRLLSMWPELERQVLRGTLAPARDAFERECRERLTAVADHGIDHGILNVGNVAASFLTTAPVFSHFCPFDFSAFSVERVRAALSVLYGVAPDERKVVDHFPVLALVGSYVSAALGNALEGNLTGSLGDLPHASVEAGELKLFPFKSLKASLERGAGFDPLKGLQLEREAMQRTRPNPVAPPCPWEPEPWPAPEEIGRYGAALPHSVVGVFCEHFAGGPLDFSLSSLPSLDHYLSLIAPSRAPAPDPDAPWLRRVAALAGAYLGQTLCESSGGAWVSVATPSVSPVSYRIALGRSEAWPMEQMLKRLRGQRMTPLLDYAKRLLAQ